MSKTVIDSLLVTLGLSNVEYKKGMDEANKTRNDFDSKNQKSDKQREADEKKKAAEAKKRAQEEERQRKATMASMNKMKRELLTFATLFTAGMGVLAFAKQTITATAALGRLSDNTKMSVEELAGLEYAFEGIGGNAENASSAVDKAAMAVASFKTGMQNQAVSGLFTAAGGTNVDLQGAFKDTKSFLLAQADVINTLYKQDPTTAMLKARQMMGVDPETFNLLKLGREEVEKRIAQGARITGISRSQADAAQRAQMQWNAMAAKFAAIGRSVLYPVLKAISTWMSQHSKEIDQWIKSISDGIKDFSPEGINIVIKAVGYLVDGLKLIVEVLAAIGKAGGEAAAWMSVDDTADNANIARENAQIKAYWAQRQASHGNTTNASSSTVNIENLNMQTQATDGKGTARDFSKNIHKYMQPQTMQANSAG